MLTGQRGTAKLVRALSRFAPKPAKNRCPLGTVAVRILVVEDSTVLRDSLTQGLREAGYAVDAVADGKRGFIHAQTTDYDIIVLDWMLPEMDGLTMLRKIRSKQVPAAVLM